MNITNVKVRLIEKTGAVKAVASVTFDDYFVVHDMRIIKKEDGELANTFIVMPSRRLHDGKFIDIAHPITKNARIAIERAVLAEYHRKLEENKEMEE